MGDFNDKIMGEFRANAGEVEMFKGIPVLILHHTGAKSGKNYEMPLAYLQEGDRKMLFASNGGDSKHPSWYFNLVAQPNVEIELGSGERVKVKATVV
jgi:deazaflavin-dependent oxidoreductase (nitroreductase family)